MRSRFTVRLLPLAVVGMLATAAPASADWLFTPYLGLNFGGDANFGDVGDLEDNFEKKAMFGASFAWMGAGVLGVEVDFGWSPNFFEITTGDRNFEFGDSNLTTLMVNAIVGAPLGPVRPYAAGGLGLMRSSISPDEFFNDLEASDLGVNIGAGLAGFVSDNVGLRGDVRYFRSLQDNEPDGNLDLGLSDFDFWRASIGVTFRFGG
jgi:opacity protein-like surface antigen